MYIKSLQLINYRNFKEITLHFEKNLNLIYGENAIGKTNILESIYILSSTKSFKQINTLKDLINKNKQYLLIKALYIKNNILNNLTISINKNLQKEINLNSKKIQTTQLIYNLTSIIISPYDLLLIESSPSIRRRFLDLNISRLDKKYLEFLKKANYVLKQKNAYLKELDINNSIIQTYNYQLSLLFSYIYKKRQEFIDEINKIINNFNIIKDLKLKYISNLQNCNIDNIFHLLQENVNKEKLQKISLIGTHRDDIKIYKENLLMKDFSSQGEKKLAIITIKMALKNMIENNLDDKIIILIDDFSSSLDLKNQEMLKFLLNSENQVILTDTKQINFKNKINEINLKKLL